MKSLKIGKIPANKAYLIGIKGVGMTALAEILKSSGVFVSGSDTKEKFFTDKTLKKLKIKCFEGFDKKNIPENPGIIISSCAYYKKNKISDNEEILEALRRKLHIYTYPEMVGLLFEGSCGIAVCGSHGKTTTTAMLAHIFKTAGLNPMAIIGSVSNNAGSNAYIGGNNESEGIFIAEADEYRDAFLNYRPKAAIITNIDYDHPDYFKNERQYIGAFQKIASRIPKNGLLVICGDDKNAAKVINKATCRVITYGKSQKNDVYFKNPFQNGFSQSFDAVVSGKTIKKIILPQIGEHNILNALACVALSGYFNIESATIKKALKTFKGTKRRMELIGRKNGAVILDDYAHHPNEIRASLSALRKAFPNKKIIAAFQPHTFSRTKKFMAEFAKAFKDADSTLLFEIYGSAREKKSAISSKDIIKKMGGGQNIYPVRTPPTSVGRFRSAHSNGVNYFKKPMEAKSFVLKNLDKNTIFITMGAGDVWKLARFVAEFTKSSPKQVLIE